MKRFLLILFAVLLVPATAFGQWTYEGGVSPVAEDADGNPLQWSSVHGVAVDPDGKIWVQPFGAKDSVQVPQMDNAWQPTRVIYVFNADGTVSDLSPIKFVSSGDGAIDDTLGGFWTGSAWEGKSGRGLSTDMDGNILVSQWKTLYKLDYKTGVALAKNRFEDFCSLAEAAASNDNIFVAAVCPAQPIIMLNPDDLSVVGNAVDAAHGFSRDFAVSPDGHRIFWAGYTTNAVIEYARPDEFSPYDSVGAVIPGVDAESFGFDPAGHLWVGAGSSNDLPNRYVGADGNPVATSWSIQTHYAFNIDDLAVDTVPAALDSIKWDVSTPENLSDLAGADGIPDGRPRGIAFSPDGNTAYVCQFNQLPPSVQKFTRDAPPASGGQWTYEGGVSPVAEDADGNPLQWSSVHGVAVDPDGKIWVQPFGAKDSVQVPQMDNAWQPTRVIYVFNADGTVSDLSPIKFVSSGDGAIDDTLGGFWTGSAWEGKSGRGLSTDMDGNILVSQWKTLYKLDYKTGVALAKNRFEDFCSLAEAAASNDNIFVAAVCPAQPIIMLNPDDLSVVGNAVDAAHGFSRDFAVSPDGHRIFWAGYTTNAVIEYARPDEFSPYDSVGAVIPGVDAESFGFDPAGHLWVGAGSSNDLPNRYVGADGNPVATSWSIQTHYAFNIDDLAVDTVPAALDSIKWDVSTPENLSDLAGADGIPDGRPRGIAFSPDGNTAYVCQFNQLPPSVQKFTRLRTTSVEDEPYYEEPSELPDRFVLHQNYPNPFNPSTTIEYEVMKVSTVTVRVYDALGRIVTTLVDGDMQQPGTYRVQWDGRTASGVQPASGVYFYSLETPDFRQVKQMVLLK